MACIQCIKDDRKLYSELSRATGNKYVEFKINNKIKFASQNDFNKLIEIGQIPATTEAEILE